MGETLAGEPIKTDGQSYLIDAELVGSVKTAVRQSDSELLAKLLKPLHGADIADLLEQVDPTERRRIVSLWGNSFEGAVLPELDDRLLEEVVEILHPSQLAEAIRGLESDDVVDFVEDLGEGGKIAVLDALASPERFIVEKALLYPDESAGRLMQSELVMAPANWNVGRAIDFLRSESDLPEQFYHIILVGPDTRPLGQVSLGRLMSSKRHIELSSIAESDFHPIPTNQSQKDVAYAFNQYHLITAPIVDRSGRLVGVITIDDAMSVLDEEAEEDIMRLAGVGDESLSDGIAETTRQRFRGWS